MNAVLICSNGCENFKNYEPGFPAGSCTLKGIKFKLTPERREWIIRVGCASMRVRS